MTSVSLDGEVGRQVRSVLSTSCLDKLGREGKKKEGRKEVKGKRIYATESDGSIQAARTTFFLKKIK